MNKQMQRKSLQLKKQLMKSRKETMNFRDSIPDLCRDTGAALYPVDLASQLGAGHRSGFECRQV